MESESDYDTRKDGKRLKKILLSDEEWDLLKELIKVLKPFEEATTYLGGSTYVTFSIIYPLIQEIKTRLRDNIQLNSISNSESFNIEELDDVFNDEFIEEMEDVEQNNSNLTQPMQTEGVLVVVNRILYNAMNFYWKFENREYMIAVMMDPRTKQLNFIMGK